MLLASTTHDKYNYIFETSGVLTEVLLNSQVFWDITPYTLVNRRSPSFILSAGDETLYYTH
jgi:hypothetical protein